MSLSTYLPYDWMLGQEFCKRLRIRWFRVILRSVVGFFNTERLSNCVSESESESQSEMLRTTYISVAVIAKRVRSPAAFGNNEVEVTLGNVGQLQVAKRNTIGSETARRVTLRSQMVSGGPKVERHVFIASGTGIWTGTGTGTVVAHRTSALRSDVQCVQCVV